MISRKFGKDLVIPAFQNIAEGLVRNGGCFIMQECLAGFVSEQEVGFIRYAYRGTDDKLSARNLTVIRLCGYIRCMKKIAHLFKALSDETRLRILSLLGEGELCVCDLMEILALPQSTISRHLAYLRNADLVEDRRQGVWMYYRLAGEESPLHRELLALLQLRLVAIPQAATDQVALHSHLAKKDRASCA
jgi:ArsR family transcriptional regulator